MIKKSLFVLLISAFILLPGLTLASSFNPDYVLSDSDYLDKNSMSAGYIQEFFKLKGSGLASISINVFGSMKSAAQIFYDAAVEHNVSQKLLIATAQKEQSVITDGSLTQNQIDKIMGYGVYPGSDYSDFMGLYNQVNYSAKQFRRYYDNPLNYNWQKDKTGVTGDGVTVTPSDKATAGLYNYTPHAGAEEGATVDDVGHGGNFLFWKIWQSWFSSDLPSGMLVREHGTGGIYYIEDGKKRPFWSRKIFDYRFQEKDVVEVDNNIIGSYSTGYPMKFSDGTLVQGSDGGVYVISNEKKRPFASRAVFDKLGYQAKGIVQANDSELNVHPRGATVAENTETNPSGTVIKSPANGGMYQIIDGKRKPIKDRSIFTNQFHWDMEANISKEIFNKYTEGSPVLYKDGTLIRDEAGNIFAIENGKRRHIERPSVFYGIGYKLENVLNVPNWIILMHPGGEPVRTY